jgi:hypothetical protein
VFTRFSHACAVALISTGCASIGPEGVDGWPALKVIEHQVTDIRAHCGAYALIPIACAEFHFAKNECHIYTKPDAPAWVLEHERAHCAGFDHPGETTMRDAWAGYLGSLQQAKTEVSQ